MLLASVLQGQAKIEAVIFLAVECTASNRYVPELNRLAAEFPGVEWRGVFSEEGMTKARLEYWKRNYSPTFLVKIDRLNEERRRAKARRTPEAFVYVNGRLAYRGRIDDRVLGWGRSKAEPESRELKMVLEQATTGKAVTVEWKEAVGCYLEH